MTLRPSAAAPLALAALLAVTGCGESCPTETPAKVDALGSCAAAPGAVVTVPVRLCPTCNQTGATCEVDTSQAATGFIQLDPTVEACENPSSCGGPTQTCQVNPLNCTFTAPTAPGSYTLLAFDPSTNRNIESTLDVSANVTPSCAFALTAE